MISSPQTVRLEVIPKLEPTVAKALTASKLRLMKVCCSVIFNKNIPVIKTNKLTKNTPIA